MSDLQIALGAVGLLVVAAVFAYNVWQERRLRRRLERAFEGQHEDVLLKQAPAPVREAAPRIEPRIEPRIPAQAEPAVVTGRAAAQPHAEAGEHGADPVIEFAIAIASGSPVGEQALHELQHQIAVFGKPARVLAHDDESGRWLSLGREAGGGYARLQAALQLANRGGPVHAPQLNGFCDAVRGWAARHGAETSVPDAAAALKAAQDLDALCGEVDVAIGINVVAHPGAAFTGDQVAEAASEAGFSLESDGIFHWRDSEGHGRFTMENHEPEPFSADRLESMQTSGMTLLLDVPRVQDAEASLDEMARVGAVLAAALGGAVVDDNRVPLQAAGIERIKAQLRDIRDSMAARGIPAGGSRALRLFA